ncbi:LOW QUALITY PROTEIN: hypothetical protein RJ640_009699 [Escallonia rubra]|uniref:Uncharacterized protein n=1 Tax=Escallonia rubra TaxID=112253 RepID=A0AA88U8Z2_9ASTE|nr:LOW QUALITY PROTEIN: hypothetical protein RJ640_009699 [Escallonia rubra]
MGFFSPGNSKNRYMGIWYKETLPVRTVVWVANRESPLTDISGELKLISDPGILVLAYGSGNIIWATNTSRPARSPALVAQLSDTGNLVLKDTRTDDGNFLWQSFDYPSDTLLPGMKLGKNFETGLERYLSSWKSNDDPSPGDFTYHCDPSGYPQNVIRKGSVEQYRSGPWNGVRFSGAPNLIPNAIYRYRLVLNDKEVYYSYDLINSSVISRVIVSQNGVVQRWMCPVGRSQGWVLYLTVPTDNCDTYSVCGAYGTCNIDDSPLCGCLYNLHPNTGSLGEREIGQMVVLERPFCNARTTHAFLKYPNVKLPDTRNSWFNFSMTLEECDKVCLKNCSCTAYANLDIREGGSGCLLWFGDLIDIRDFPDGAGQDIYVRVASSDSEIAVKRLSKTSRQGPVEFKNEVICIAKLQHRNLVKLLGCCIEGKEKILIYEYMPNKSLDSFIFGLVIYSIMRKETNLLADETRSMLLDWPKRFDIINGIARGLLYLHQDSRLRIIHRDLKASNILLDSNMDPKISDFGLARCFADSETGANTNRVVGTYGYMSPEYAIDGFFSVKSDLWRNGAGDSEWEEK